MVREIHDGLLVDRDGFLLPYCLRCRPGRLVDRIDLDDLLIRDVRYGLFPGTAMRPYRACPQSCRVGRWSPPSGSRPGSLCPWCPLQTSLDCTEPEADHQEDFTLWSQELTPPTPGKS